MELKRQNVTLVIGASSLGLLSLN